VAPNQNDAELERQRGYIKQLEDELARLKQSLMNKDQASMHSAANQANQPDEFQDRILKELEYLKGNPQVLSKPGTGS